LETKNGKVTIPQLPPDTTPPTITVLSPENKTYTSNQCPLTFTVDEPVSTIQFNLDDQANSTTPGNTTLTNLSEGEHKIIIYANDTHGNTGQSGPLFFSVDTSPPLISSVTQPNETLPLETTVKINATITDTTTGVRQALLNYTYTNSTGTWNDLVNMTHVELNLWQAEIAAFPSNTNVTYSVTAEDYAGNSITTGNFWYESGEPTVYEYTPIFVLLILMTATTLLLAIGRKKKIATLA
jgi:hypothetical protein